MSLAQEEEEAHMIQYRPIIPWIGGKRRLAPHVLSKFGDHTCYVEAFAGGAAVFFMKAPSDVEVLNDVNGELARSIDGAMLISLNDHPDIRACFAGLHMETVAITYTVGGGRGSAARELLIWNDHCEKRRHQHGNLALF